MSVRFAAALVVLTLASCGKEDGSAHVVATDEEVATSSTWEAYFLEPEILAKEMELARAGDNQSALRVANHYSMAELQPDEELPWLLMAAERGDIGAMVSLGHRFGSGVNKDTDCAKAIDWLGRAKRDATPAEMDTHGVVELLVDITGEGGTCRGMSPN